MSGIDVDSATRPTIRSSSKRIVVLGCLLSLLLPIAIIAVALGVKPGPLPMSSLASGRVVDAETLQPIQGATVTYRWWIQDYPAMDGGSPTNAFKVEFVTNSNGDFSYVSPTKRRGRWLTNEYPPEIDAKGYWPIMHVNDPSHLRIVNGTRLILMKPERARSGSLSP